MRRQPCQREPETNQKRAAALGRPRANFKARCICEVQARNMRVTELLDANTCSQ